MNHDRPLIAVLLGAISTVPYEIFTKIMVALGFGKYSVYQLSSLIIAVDRPSEGLGVATTSIIGSAIAIILYYSLEKLGYDYIVIKGFVSGVFAWGLTEFLYTWLLEGRNFIHRPMEDYYVELVGAIMFGITLGLLFRRFIIPYLSKDRKNS